MEHSIKLSSHGQEAGPSAMRLVGENDYRLFVKSNRTVPIEKVNVPIGRPWKITEYGPPREYKPEGSTVWSFPNRGDWATHSGNYRGNWSPYIPRNLIQKFTVLGETVLDQMCGSGTTLVECKLLGRNAIGVDVNSAAVMVASDRLNFDYRPLDRKIRAEIRAYVGDARNLDLVRDESIDLVATHPPYAGIIPYGREVPGDLSRLKLLSYIQAMRTVATESFRVLKENRYCAVLMGDTRKGRHYIPITVGILEAFLAAGFVLREDIIKLQHKMMATREKWRGRSYEFYKIAHEHLYIFRKPGRDELTSRIKYSKKWW